ncbi:MAG: hypothetical protein ACOY71_04330 [Gemmatimonadota bacterium]
MRPRDRILQNLESIYRESYERLKAAGATARTEEMDAAFVRDQLVLEILLDIRDLIAQTPAAKEPSPSALEKLEAIRRLTRLRP